MKTNKNHICRQADQNTENKLEMGFFPRGLFLFAQFAIMAKQIEEKPTCRQARQSKQKKLRMKTLSILSVIIILFSSGIKTQAQDAQETKTRSFQISFITPLGTNGLDAPNITNKFSLNILAGYNGGLDGFEFSGFGSILKTNMKGVQLSSFGNIVLGTSNGFQGAGFFNYSQQYFNGVQIAGFSNIINSEAKGWQFSGFTNITTKELDGGQFASFGNYSKGNTKGQASGFVNINKGDLSGFQIAGFSNINTEKTEGTQIAGFFNYTEKLKGIQIAPFNYVDSLEKGTPIGIFSIVKNGYKSFEISSNETLYGVVSYKTGTKKFYNIISVGASYKNDMVLWGWGYGIGTMADLKNDWDLAIELISYQINQDAWFTETLNQNNKLQLTTSKKVSENLNVFGGISWNVNVSETIDNNGNDFKSSISPWNIFDKTYGNDTNVKMYPGFTIGVRF